MAVLAAGKPTAERPLDAPGDAASALELTDVDEKTPVTKTLKAGTPIATTLR